MSSSAFASSGRIGSTTLTVIGKETFPFERAERGGCRVDNFSAGCKAAVPRISRWIPPSISIHAQTMSANFLLELILFDVEKRAFASCQPLARGSTLCLKKFFESISKCNLFYEYIEDKALEN
jgi:hypothetical protein